MVPTVKLDLGENHREEDLEDIKGYKVVVASMMYTALAMWPNILLPVAARC